jgi:adenosylhomocysteine nucleosidase
MASAIAIVASMERELAFLRRSLRGQAAGSFLFQVSGTGKARALRGVEALFQSPNAPGHILSVGFAGALTEELRTGDLVLSRRLYATGEEQAVESDGALLELAQETLEAQGNPRHFVADSLTVGAPVCTVSEKKAFAARTSAWIANMEDYWVGGQAALHGVPFLSVRVVLDTADQEIPEFAAALGDRGPLMQALVASAKCIARPGNLPVLLKLSRQTRTAQASLERFRLPFVSKISVDRRAGHYAAL